MPGTINNLQHYSSLSSSLWLLLPCRILCIHPVSLYLSFSTTISLTDAVCQESSSIYNIISVFHLHLGHLLPCRILCIRLIHPVSLSLIHLFLPFLSNWCSMPRTINNLQGSNTSNYNSRHFLVANPLEYNLSTGSQAIISFTFKYYKRTGKELQCLNPAVTDPVHIIVSLPSISGYCQETVGRDTWLVVIFNRRYNVWECILQICSGVTLRGCW